MVLNNLVIYLAVIEISSKATKKIRFFFDVFHYFSIPILYDHIITSSSVFSRVPSNPAAAAAGDRLRLRPRAPGCCGCPADSGGGNAGTLPVMLLVFNGEIRETPRSDSWGLIHVPWGFFTAKLCSNPEIIVIFWWVKALQLQ